MTLWKVAEAKRSLSRLLRDAETEPQLIQNRDRLVAAILGAEEARAYLEWRGRQRVPALSDLVADLVTESAREGYELPCVPREDRPNPLLPDPGTRRRREAPSTPQAPRSRTTRGARGSSR
jgi:hypothetical protein